jgi:hypothetical protein
MSDMDCSLYLNITILAFRGALIHTHPPRITPIGAQIAHGDRLLW